ncbi:hypothetical protein DFJ73DRAFT_799040 [Zopfochytrium polystomum]|nr:hypothetical protein DFJ73DRAFT_799040 [Zopfochytrium polystomum]
MDHHNNAWSSDQTAPSRANMLFPLLPFAHILPHCDARSAHALSRVSRDVRRAAVAASPLRIFAAAVNRIIVDAPSTTTAVHDCPPPPPLLHDLPSPPSSPSSSPPDHPSSPLHRRLLLSPPLPPTTPPVHPALATLRARLEHRACVANGGDPGPDAPLLPLATLVRCGPVRPDVVAKHIVLRCRPGFNEIHDDDDDGDGGKPAAFLHVWETKRVRFGVAVEAALDVGGRGPVADVLRRTVGAAAAAVGGVEPVSAGAPRRGGGGGGGMQVFRVADVRHDGVVAAAGLAEALDLLCPLGTASSASDSGESGGGWRSSRAAVRVLRELCARWEREVGVWRGAVEEEEDEEGDGESEEEAEREIGLRPDGPKEPWAPFAEWVGRSDVAQVAMDMFAREPKRFVRWWGERVGI